MSPERNRPNLSEPVENVVSAEMQGFTIADLCPAVEKAWDSVRLSFVPCPMSQKKSGGGEPAFLTAIVWVVPVRLW